MSQHHTLCRTSKKVHLMETDRVNIFHLLIWFVLMCTFNRTNLTTYPWVWFDLFSTYPFESTCKHKKILNIWISCRIYLSLTCRRSLVQRVTSGNASSIKSVPHQLPASIYRENLWGNKSTAKSTCVNTLPLRPATVISSWPVSLLFRSKKF